MKTGKVAVGERRNLEAVRYRDSPRRSLGDTDCESCSAHDEGIGTCDAVQQGRGQLLRACSPLALKDAVKRAPLHAGGTLADGTAA